jgi:hydrogenase small subunit
VAWLLEGTADMGNMNDIFDTSRKTLQDVEKRLEMPRREFLQFCATLAATMGLPAGAEAAVAKAVEAAKRPSVIWLHFQECTGCSESLLRAEHPTLEKLILDVISLDYHETLMAAAGHQAEDARKAAMKANKGKYVLVVEGAIPTKANGIYCKIGGHTAIDMLKECAADAAAVIAIGSCASWGGMPSTIPSISGADSSPTGSAGVAEILGKPVMTIPGCPPNPYNFLAAVVHFLTFGKLPELDKLGRPKFAYSRLIHENCERRAHFDAGRFAMEFGDSAATDRATASTSWAARAPRPMPTARPWVSAMPARTTGRSAAAIPASAAPKRASASPSRSTRSPKCSTSRRRCNIRASSKSRARPLPSHPPPQWLRWPAPPPVLP